MFQRSIRPHASFAASFRPLEHCFCTCHPKTCNLLSIGKAKYRTKQAAKRWNKSNRCDVCPLPKPKEANKWLIASSSAQAAVALSLWRWQCEVPDLQALSCRLGPQLLSISDFTPCSTVVFFFFFLTRSGWHHIGVPSRSHKKL